MSELHDLLLEDGETVDVGERDAESLDAFSLQRFEDFLPAHAESRQVEDHLIHVVDVRAAGAGDGRLQAGERGKAGREPRGGALAAGDLAVEFLELLEADRALDFAEAEIVSDHVAEIGHALVAHDGFGVVADEAQALGDLDVVGHEDAAFAGVDVLVVIEAEAADIGERAGGLAVIQRTRSLCAVGDELEAVLPGEGAEGVHVGRLTCDVHGEDGARVRGDVRLDGARIEAEGVGLDVGEDRNGVPMEDRGRRGAHRPRARDHFVARLNADGADGGDEARCPGVHGDGATHAEFFGAGLLELADFRAAVEVGAPAAVVLREDAAFDDRLRGGDFLGAEGVVARERARDRLRAAVERERRGEDSAHGGERAFAAGENQVRMEAENGWMSARRHSVAKACSPVQSEVVTPASACASAAVKWACTRAKSPGRRSAMGSSPPSAVGAAACHSTSAPARS
jgi:hypothetical protein